METVPFSSTSRGALLLTGGGSGWSRHRQQEKMEKKPPLLGFLEDREGEEPAEEEEAVSELQINKCMNGINHLILDYLRRRKRNFPHSCFMCTNPPGGSRVCQELLRNLLCDVSSKHTQQTTNEPPALACSCRTPPTGVQQCCVIGYVCFTPITGVTVIKKTAPSPQRWTPRCSRVMQQI